MRPEMSRGYEPQQEQPKPKKPDLKIVRGEAGKEEMEVTSLADSMMEKEVPGGFELDQPPLMSFRKGANATKEAKLWIDRMFDEEPRVTELLMKKMRADAKKLATIRGNILAEATDNAQRLQAQVDAGRLAPKKAEELLETWWEAKFKTLTGEKYAPADEGEAEMFAGILWPVPELADVRSGKKQPDAAAREYMSALVGQAPVEKALRDQGLVPKKIADEVGRRLGGVIKMTAEAKKGDEEAADAVAAKAKALLREYGVKLE
jgi:hypothetical protein